jgi:hypothetical protein
MLRVHSLMMKNMAVPVAFLLSTLECISAFNCYTHGAALHRAFLPKLRTAPPCAKLLRFPSRKRTAVGVRSLFSKNAEGLSCASWREMKKFMHLRMYIWLSVPTPFLFSAVQVPKCVLVFVFLCVCVLVCHDCNQPSLSFQVPYLLLQRISRTTVSCTWKHLTGSK